MSPQQAARKSTGEEHMKGVRHLCDNGVTRVPSRYVLPLPDRPHAAPAAAEPKLKLPVIDVGRLLSPTHRARVLQTLDAACKEYGFFQVVNHQIDPQVIERMIDMGRRFFELPFEERAEHMTNDIRGPVRCGTSFNKTKDRVFCWRDFLKLSCHPLETVLPFWPSSPPGLREKAVEYSRSTRSLFMVVMAGVLESLGVVDSASVVEEFEGGSQLLVVNCYPPCPEPELTLGMPPHSDYGFLTVVLQDDVEGLQVLHGGEWITVDPVPGSFVVNVGDHLEIFSNGRYKSVLHRVLVNSARLRLSVASLHSLPFEGVVCPSPALVSEDHPKLYMDTNFAAFLEYMSSCETEHKNFLESRKLTPRTPSFVAADDREAFD